MQHNKVKSMLRNGNVCRLGAYSKASSLKTSVVNRFSIQNIAGHLAGQYPEYRNVNSVSVTLLPDAAVDLVGGIACGKMIQDKLFDIRIAYHFHHFFQIAVLI